MLMRVSAFFAGAIATKGSTKCFELRFEECPWRDEALYCGRGRPHWLHLSIRFAHDGSVAMSTHLIQAPAGTNTIPATRALALAMRPHQWVKNLLLFGGLIFSKSLFDPNLLLRSVQGFFLFCFASSAVHLLNDLQDIENDRMHPKKRLRPLASGDLSPRLAIPAMLALILLAVAGGFQLGITFGALISEPSSRSTWYSTSPTRSH